MEIRDREVRFDKYCVKCKHFKESEFDPESTCYLCMFDGSNESTDKPTKFAKNS